MTAERRLVFRLSRHRWAIRLADLAGVTERPALREVPAAPAWVRGLAERHGRIVTVLDLAHLLGEGPGQGPPALLLLAPPRAHLALEVAAEVRLALREEGSAASTSLSMIC